MKISLAAALLKNVRIIRAGPRLNFFLWRYLDKFKARKVGSNVIIHSHLPPLNSRAYGRFIDEHLLARTERPSHAQVGLTDACPQKCAYCYNRGRSGRPMDTPTIIRVIKELRDMGVFWLGLTGGEPLLNKDILKITETAAADCAVKLFTTGCTLTPEMARNLKSAGLFSVSVSLDHWREDLHDRSRGYPGAFRAALAAVRTFREVAGLDVGVSAVLSKSMIAERRVEEYLRFLEGLDIHEAWLSETKPSIAALRDVAQVITEAERLYLVALQDEWNARGGMTVNYLGHFEGREHFGCNAGRKMIYVDAFGEVSPCVFTPLVFGNAQARPLAAIYQEMKDRFRSGNSCFMNANSSLFRKYGRPEAPVVSGPAVQQLMSEARFGSFSRFMELYHR
jgi:MoaA/NifB/PqqE/SkfB family radical SAM enzyme